MTARATPTGYYVRDREECDDRRKLPRLGAIRIASRSHFFSCNRNFCTLVNMVKAVVLGAAGAFISTQLL